MNQQSTSFKDPRTAGETFQITLKGLWPNVSPTEAREKLAALFRADAGQVEKLPAIHGYVVKKSCTLEVATKSKNVIGATFAICELVSEESAAIALEVDLPDAEPPTPGAKNGTGDETVLFQGDASLLKGPLSIVLGEAIGTTRKFVFSDDKKEDITLRPSDILSAVEVKHGFGTKRVVKTNAGDTYQFLAANMVALRQGPHDFPASAC